jgi:hypothetical protein
MRGSCHTFLFTILPVLNNCPATCRSLYRLSYEVGDIGWNIFVLDTMIRFYSFVGRLDQCYESQLSEQTFSHPSGPCILVNVLHE